jgi:hypothetical protein
MPRPAWSPARTTRAVLFPLILVTLALWGGAVATVWSP